MNEEIRLLKQSRKHCIANITFSKEDMQEIVDKAFQKNEVITGMTVKECVEKQIAKKPIDRCMFKECPSCGNVEIENCSYCPDCGQKIEMKW